VKRASLRSVLERRLRTVAAERGIALTHVADRAGVGRSHLWRLLNGEAAATLDVVDKIAAALDVPPLDLLDDSPKRSGRSRA
jgi:transcriptional regulator with XRE-family HTH domain